MVDAGQSSASGKVTATGGGHRQAGAVILVRFEPRLEVFWVERAPVLAYLGAALVLAAVATVVASRWEDIALAGRLAVIGIGTAIGLVGGAVARRRPGPPFDRVTSVLWLASVAGIAGLAGLVFGSDGLDVSEDVLPAVAAGTSGAVAAVLE